MPEQVTVKLPNSMSFSELVDSGKSPEEAKRIMHQRVFGDGVQFKDGKVIEVGLGAPGHETAEHFEALALRKQREAMANPNSADVIAAAVAAGVKAGLASKEAEAM